MSASQRRIAGIGLLAVAAVLLVGLWFWSGQGGSSPSASPSLSASPSRSSASAPRDTSGLPVVAVSDLPAEARDTLGLIAAGGPFPYSRDGVVFQNRERILPSKATGWYHEYTVPTPGEGDRGARRIVTGKDGQRYWSDDHYDSFSVIQEEP
jgi:ribonuclease T1